jgi:hypothetical protein
MPTASANIVEAMLITACAEGNKRLSETGISYSDDSKKNERFVVEVLMDVASSVGIPAKSIRHLGGKAFPDVLIEGTRIGIELKGSRKGGAITGNSIYSGSMVEDLDKVYLLFWIDDRIPKLGFRDYFDCVFDAKVTHSPRFALQVDLPIGESMFGTGSNQLGFEAADWLTGDAKYVERIVVEIRRRALERDEIPWWVVADAEGAVAVEIDSGGGLGGLRSLRGIGRTASFSLQKTLFLGFPEVLSGGSAAHSIAIGWAISQKSVIINRDVFSAGGKRTIRLLGLGVSLKLPGVIGKCAEKLSCDAPVSLKDLSEIGGTLLETPGEAVQRFKSALLNQKILDDLFEHLSTTERSRITKRTLKTAVTDYLIARIDPSTLI